SGKYESNLFQYFTATRSSRIKFIQPMLYNTFISAFKSGRSFSVIDVYAFSIYINLFMFSIFPINIDFLIFYKLYLLYYYIICYIYFFYIFLMYNSGSSIIPAS